MYFNWGELEFNVSLAKFNSVLVQQERPQKLPVQLINKTYFIPATLFDPFFRKPSKIKILFIGSDGIMTKPYIMNCSYRMVTQEIIPVINLPNPTNNMYLS